MDKDTSIFVGIVLTIAVLLLSRCFPKNERTRFILVGFAIIGAFAAVLSLTFEVEPRVQNMPKWLATAVIEIPYHIILMAFAGFAIYQSEKTSKKKNKEEDSAIDDASTASSLTKLHGRIGITKTQHSPSGITLIDGVEYESQSVLKHIEKGMSVRVVGHSMRHLKIEPAELNNASK